MSTLTSIKDKVTSAAKNSRLGQMGGVSSLTPLALSVVSLVIVVAVGAVVLGEMNDSITDANATTVLNTGSGALQTFADFFTVIIIIGIAAVIFLLLSVVRRAGTQSSV